MNFGPEGEIVRGGLYTSTRDGKQYSINEMTHSEPEPELEPKPTIVIKNNDQEVIKQIPKFGKYK
jgi:hypothetical protein